MAGPEYQGGELGRRAILPGGFRVLAGVRIDEEIQHDRNVHAVWVEGAVLAGLLVTLT